MPDNFDLSQEQQDDMLSYHISEQRRMFPPIPIIDCLNTCGPDVPHKKNCEDYRYCVEDWERRNREGYNTI